MTETKKALYETAVATGAGGALRAQDYQRARKLGINVTIPEPQLPRWSARTSTDRDEQVVWWPRPSDRIVVDEKRGKRAIVVDARMTLAVEQTLERAVDDEAGQFQLLQAESGLRGYEWYDRLDRLINVDVHAINGNTQTRIDTTTGGRHRGAANATGSYSR